MVMFAIFLTLSTSGEKIVVSYWLLTPACVSAVSILSDINICSYCGLWAYYMAFTVTCEFIMWHLLWFVSLLFGVWRLLWFVSLLYGVSCDLWFPASCDLTFSWCFEWYTVVFSWWPVVYNVTCNFQVDLPWIATCDLGAVFVLWLVTLPCLHCDLSSYRGVLLQVIKSLGRTSQLSVHSDLVDAEKPFSSNVGRYKVKRELQLCLHVSSYWKKQNAQIWLLRWLWSHHGYELKLRQR